jgi:hypothetical protein
VSDFGRKIRSIRVERLRSASKRAAGRSSADVVRPCDRSGPGDDHRQLDGHRQDQGPDPARSCGARPYFHNGSAKDLATVVTFYNQRFNIGLTPQQQSDLVTFLETLYTMADPSAFVAPDPLVRSR